MSDLTGWVGSGAGLIIVGISWVLMHYHDKHGDRVHDAVHPWLHRLGIAGMYVGGCTLAQSALGSITGTAADWVLNLGGSYGLAHAVIVVAGVFLFLGVLFGILIAPARPIAWMALIFPFVAQLAGGHLHKILSVIDGAAVAAAISHWIGG